MCQTLCQHEYNDDQKLRHMSCPHEAYSLETGTKTHTKRHRQWQVLWRLWTWNIKIHKLRKLSLVNILKTGFPEKAMIKLLFEEWAGD